MGVKKEVFQTVILNFIVRDIPKTYSRDIEIPIGIQKIVSLVGPRRSGKTYLLYDTINTLHNQGVSREAFVYINFEDDGNKFTGFSYAGHTPIS